MTKTTFTLMALAGLITLTIVSAQGSKKSPSKDEPVALDNMHHLMEYVFEPNFKRLKATLATEISSDDKATFKAMKGDSLTLAEASNLLLHRLPDEDVDEWLRLAVESRTTGFDLYQAARKRDYEAASHAFRVMLKSCNACHDKFADGDYQLEP